MSPTLRVGLVVGRARLVIDVPGDAWIIRCACGREQRRSRRTIQQAIAAGRGVHCDVCAAEVRALHGRAAIDRAWRTPGRSARLAQRPPRGAEPDTRSS